MNKKATLSDYIILLRPTLFVPVWTVFLIGHWFSKTRFDLLSLLSILLYTLMMGGVYILNQIVDIESDRENRKLFLLPDGIISKNKAFLLMFILFGTTIPASFAVNPTFGILFILSAIMGVLYSLPPFQLKARPFLDMLSNGVGYGMLAFLSGYTIHKPLNSLVLLQTLPYFFAVSAVFVNTTIPDIPGDKKAGKKTTGVLLGKRITLISGVLLDLISLVLSILFKDIICGIAATVSLPFFVIALVKPTKKNILFSIRLTAPALTIISAVLYPGLVLLLLVIYFGQKAYYKRRFNLNYPSITSGIDSDF
ncbi:hypothetical protein DRQ17_05920 [bacterium]|nr:MAG: hypothetical protein DRQ17_05920 [bacterium]